jgi:hypothetical protein
MRSAPVTERALHLLDQIGLAPVVPLRFKHCRDPRTALVSLAQLAVRTRPRGRGSV